MSYPSFKKASVINNLSDTSSPPNSVNFDFSGENLLFSSNSEISYLTPSLKNQGISTINVDEIGCLTSTPTLNDKNILFSSKNSNKHSISYFSFKEQKHILTFNTNGQKVNALKSSPIDQIFISAEFGGIFRIWDFRDKNCQAKMETKQSELNFCIDPEGLIFAVGCPGCVIKLFDIRNNDQGPFLSFKLEKEEKKLISSMEISQNGKLLVARSSSDEIYVVDAFNGQLKSKFEIENENLIFDVTKTGYKSEINNRLNISIAGNNQFFIAGSEEGILTMFPLPSENSPAEPCKFFSGAAESILTALSPTKVLAASASKTEKAIWLHKRENNAELEAPLKPVFDDTKKFELFVKKGNLNNFFKNDPTGIFNIG